MCLLLSGQNNPPSNFYHKSHVISIIVFLSSQIDFVCQNFAHKLCTTGVCAAAATRIKSLMVGSGRGKGKGGLEQQMCKHSVL